MISYLVFIWYSAELYMSLTTFFKLFYSRKVACVYLKHLAVVIMKISVLEWKQLLLLFSTTYCGTSNIKIELFSFIYWVKFGNMVHTWCQNYKIVSSLAFTGHNKVTTNINCLVFEGIYVFPVSELCITNIHYIRNFLYYYDFKYNSKFSKRHVLLFHMHTNVIVPLNFYEIKYWLFLHNNLFQLKASISFHP